MPAAPYQGFGRVPHWTNGSKARAQASCEPRSNDRAPASLAPGRMPMSAKPSAPTRRSVIVASAAAGAASLLPAYAGAAAEEAIETDAIRPFHVNVPEDALVDLRRRINATLWPERETVADQSQGVP